MATVAFTAAESQVTEQTVKARAALTASATIINTFSLTRSAVLRTTATLITVDGITRSTTLTATATLTSVSSHVRVTQAGVEVLIVPSPNLRITQTGIEILINNTRFLIQIPASAQFNVNTIIRTIPATVRFRKTPSRTIPASVVVSRKQRSILATARVRVSSDQVIPASAEIGFRRNIPCSAIFVGTKGRSFPAYAMFRVAGIIPASASFWIPVAQSFIVSDSQSKIMSMSSRLVGGSIGHYLGFPDGNNAALPVGWDLPTYNDSFWQPPVVSGVLFFPFPYSNAAVRRLDFNWAWPSPTGDYASNSGAFGDRPTCDPWHDHIVTRRAFGLPNDLVVVAHTSGVLQAASWGTLNCQILAARINGFNLPFAGYQITNPGFVSGVWTVPTTVLLPGSNVLAIITTSYISTTLNSRATQFLLTLNYQPGGTGLPQVIG